MPMPNALRYLQYTGCALTEVFSFYLFILILTRSSKKFGAYKYLMAVFSLFSMGYGVVEVLTQPVIHIEGTALILIVDSFLKTEKVIGFHVAVLYCSSYGVCVALLSTHFCYRYLAVCRPHVIQRLTGRRLAYLFIPSLFFGVLWFATVDYCARPTAFNSEYLKESLRQYYNEDSYSVAQISFVYYYYNNSNQLIIHWAQVLSMFFLSSIMGFTITSIIIFAVKTYKSVEKSRDKWSPMTRDLHRQLFNTLVLQSLVPFFIMFLPVALIFSVPLLNVHPGYLANTPGIWISFYPAIDAVIAVLMIRDFRDALFCMLKKQKVLEMLFLFQVENVTWQWDIVTVHYPLIFGDSQFMQCSLVYIILDLLGTFFATFVSCSHA
uniref:Serpentine receptor class r-10 n=1 Tax=Caenorhabditis tropicalis TaxID=1561998 RepID=A0A1I7T1K3_9PELO